MEIFTHKCTKCSLEYQDTEPEPYYCEVCNKERLAVAKEVDARLGSTVGQQPGGEYQAYLKGPKVRGFLHVKL